MSKKFQDLSLFKLPDSFRGKSAFFVQLWWLFDAIFFKNSPQFMYGFRVLLLRFFGAKIGKNCIIRPSAVFTYPWKVSIGDNVWIGDNVSIYSLGEILIGSDSVISQGTYVCAGDHDYNLIDFPIRSRPINIGSQVWIGANVFIGPGVAVGDGAVVGACSCVFKSLPSGMVCMGYPAKPVKKRMGGLKAEVKRTYSPPPP